MYNVVIYNSVVSIDLSILFRVWCLSSIFKAAVISNFSKNKRPLKCNRIFCVCLI